MRRWNGCDRGRSTKRTNADGIGLLVNATVGIRNANGYRGLTELISCRNPTNCASHWIHRQSRRSCNEFKKYRIKVDIACRNIVAVLFAGYGKDCTLGSDLRVSIGLVALNLNGQVALGYSAVTVAYSHSKRLRTYLGTGWRPRNPTVAGDLHACRTGNEFKRQCIAIEVRCNEFSEVGQSDRCILTDVSCKRWRCIVCRRYNGQ